MCSSKKREIQDFLKYDKWLPYLLDSKNVHFHIQWKPPHPCSNHWANYHYKPQIDSNLFADDIFDITRIIPAKKKPFNQSETQT